MSKVYQCVCGKEFKSINSLNGHKANCKEYHLSKYGNLDVYNQMKEGHNKHNKLWGQQQKKKTQELKQQKLQQWINEGHTCEMCGKVMTEYYGSGRFCSRSCANVRQMTPEIKRQISITLGGTGEPKQPKPKKVKPPKPIKIKKPTKQEQLKQLRQQKAREKEYYISNLLDTNNWNYLVYNDLQFGQKYLVSKQGEILSCYTGKLLQTAYKQHADYIRYVCRDVNGKQHIIYSHRAVACTYIPNPNNFPAINHIDDNPLNNSVENLEWCTIDYNNRHSNVYERVAQQLRGRTAWNKGLKMGKRNKKAG